jgi:hypothetical protein
MMSRFLIAALLTALLATLLASGELTTAWAQARAIPPNLITPIAPPVIHSVPPLILIDPAITKPSLLVPPPPAPITNLQPQAHDLRCDDQQHREGRC